MKKELPKAHIFLVDTFKGLVVLVLTLLSFLMMIALPFVFFAMSVASIRSGEWLTGLGYLVLVIVSFYTALGLTELLKDKKE